MRLLTPLALSSFLLLPGGARAIARGAGASSPTSVTAKIAPWLQERAFLGTQPPASFFVVLNQEADLSGAELLGSREERTAYVRDALVGVAEASQRDLRAHLTARGIPHRSFHIVNMVLIEGGPDVLLELASRDDVLRIEGNPTIRNDRLQAGTWDEDALAARGRAAQDTSTAGANIVATRAPEVWALGHTGQGIVLGGQDTGYSWTHPALRDAYRGWDRTAARATHDFNWHDSVHTTGSQCGKDSPEPCDDNAHGTHTMGTAVGDDGQGNQIGMAPGARWIGCRDMDRGNGTPATYAECLEFFLAPYPVGGTPQQGDPSLAPHVTNNSWGCPPSEGCSPTSLRSALDAHRAAGIFTVASAGNSGPGCGTVAEPPAIFDSSYSVGALQTGTDLIASFSSRGPVTVDGSRRSKPDIAAPGTNVRSSVPGGAYQQSGWSGTSMAGPHVAGAVALLWSAQRALLGQIDQTIRILNETAVPLASESCASSGFPNNTFGYGRLDARAAVDDALVRPILTGLSPLSGPGSGGTPVVITGANFTPSAQVTFGTVPAASVTVESPTRLVALSPAQAASGPVDVVVAVPGRPTGRRVSAFSYCAAPDVSAMSNSPLCEGQTLHLSATAIPGARYQWRGPLGFASAERSPSIPRAGVAASGAYTVSVTGDCSSGEATTQVLVNPFPRLQEPDISVIFGCAPLPETAVKTGPAPRDDR